MSQSKLGQAYLASVDADSRAVTAAEPVPESLGAEFAQPLTLLPIMPVRVTRMALQEPPRVLNSDSCSGMATLTVEPSHPKAPPLTADPHAIRMKPARKAPQLLTTSLPPIPPQGRLHIRLAIEGHHTQLRRGGIVRFVYGLHGDHRNKHQASVGGGDSSDDGGQAPVAAGAGAGAGAGASAGGAAPAAGIGAPTYFYTSARQGMASLAVPGAPKGGATGSTDKAGRRGSALVEDLASTSPKHYRGNIEGGDAASPLLPVAALTDETTPTAGAAQVHYSSDIVVRAQFIRPAVASPTVLEFGHVPISTHGAGPAQPSATPAVDLADVAPFFPDDDGDGDGVTPGAPARHTLPFKVRANAV